MPILHVIKGAWRELKREIKRFVASLTPRHPAPVPQDRKR